MSDVIQVLKSFLGPMIAANRGHVVTIASGAGIFGKLSIVFDSHLISSSGINKLTDYCSSKFAAVGLHDSLTSELKQMNKEGVQTTVICPVFINTGMFQGVSSS